MKKYFATYFRNFDYLLFFTYVFLCIFGLVMIYSASMMVGIRDYNQPDYYYQKQITNLAVGAVAFIAGAFIPYKHYSRNSVMFLGILAIIILFTWVKVDGVGLKQTGAQSWIQIMGTSFQPSEFAKVFIIVYLAGSFYNKSVKKGSMELVKPRDIWQPILIWLCILIGVLTETDIGAAIILFGIAMAVLFLSGIKGKSLVQFFMVLGTVGVVGGALAFLVKYDTFINSNRFGRLQAWFNPFEFSQGVGYQIINGYLAIGQGGLDGLGLGQSIQKLGYLPEPHNDFIMAVIVEELGIKGVLIVFIGLSIIIIRSLWIAMTTKDPLARIIAGGIGCWIGIQALVNLGGVSGVIPLTGVTLPFISYGGTSILMLSLAMGILMNVSMFYKKDKKRME